MNPFQKVDTPLQTRVWTEQRQEIDLERSAAPTETSPGNIQRPLEKEFVLHFLCKMDRSSSFERHRNS